MHVTHLACRVQPLVDISYWFYFCFDFLKEDIINPIWSPKAKIILIKDKTILFKGLFQNICQILAKAKIQILKETEKNKLKYSVTFLLVMNFWEIVEFFSLCFSNIPNFPQ